MSTALAYTIRPARPEDAPRLPEIERLAGRLFAGVVAGVDGDAPGDVDGFRRAQRRGHLWVAAGADDVPVAFALFEALGDTFHLEEVDVHPDHARQGLGARVIEAGVVFARKAGYADVTLATYREVPWNAPYYAQLGFEELPPEAWSPVLRNRVAEEARRGLDPALRVVMRCPLGPITEAGKEAR